MEKATKWCYPFVWINVKEAVPVDYIQCSIARGIWWLTTKFIVTSDTCVPRSFTSHRSLARMLKEKRQFTLQGLCYLFHLPSGFEHKRAQVLNSSLKWRPHGPENCLVVTLWLTGLAELRHIKVIIVLLTNMRQKHQDTLSYLLTP